MKTVYLHVGNFKTGTTAIQKFCDKNSKALNQQGLLYLKGARPPGRLHFSHSALALSLLTKYDAYTPPWYSHKTSFDELAMGISREISEGGCEKLLLSSEEFFRLPSLTNSKQKLAGEDLTRLFSACDVRVVMYIREPLSFAKSWYNEVNKSPLPCVRFADFVYHLDPTYIDPQINARYWRNLFGEHALIVRSYNAAPESHIQDFLSLLGITMEGDSQSSTRIVNPGRDERSLETDRLAKIYANTSENVRASLLRSQTFSSASNINSLKHKAATISESFNAFCRSEGIEAIESKLSFEEILVHEELVNRKDAPVPGFGKRMYYRAMNHSQTRRLKSAVKAWSILK